MDVELLHLAAELSRRGEPFALATVVRREPASSARTGDRAIVTQGGTFHGWLGGSCTQPTVIREAARAIATGLPRLVLMSPVPDRETPRPGLTVLPMTCHSGGSVEIFIAPVVPAPVLLVYGVSPAAMAVARFGKGVGYDVTAVDPQADRTLFPEVDHIVTDADAPELRQRALRAPARLYVVVATLGSDDATSLRGALAFEPAYLGLVASRARFGELRALLADQGVTDASIDKIKCPAGLDIGATSPEEIALSILAEIVERARRAPAETADAMDAPGATAAPAMMVDPVCGMDVDPATSPHHAEVDGVAYAFCCGGCRERFLANPARYLSASGADS